MPVVSKSRMLIWWMSPWVTDPSNLLRFKDPNHPQYPSMRPFSSIHQILQASAGWRFMSLISQSPPASGHHPFINRPSSQPFVSLKHRPPLYEIAVEDVAMPRQGHSNASILWSLEGWTINHNSKRKSYMANSFVMIELLRSSKSNYLPNQNN